MNNIFLDELAIKITLYRKRKKFSQVQLAELANLSTNTISAYENGKENIKILNLLSVADALDIPISKLVDFHKN